MIGELSPTNWKLVSKSIFTLPNQDSKTIVMEARAQTSVPSRIRETRNIKRSITNTPMNEGVMRQMEYNRSLSQGNGKKALRGSCFGLESMVLLVCLTASLLILPLILPPLPPPPFLLLLVPIGILGLLMILAFMPYYNVRDSTYSV